ncbi:hypothetical protein L873DRAFT_1843158 [Choiromyces venosus 120613-1]|uniref:Uncharacterized protein n=1 Tax=Choiromyces venosus 120613-1 TaxID=1336337 RepID=A0A3N4JPP0_9PEZI|nr:hypothetical protein L873DRAFT_1843158 [Choiromyces venosus 120613-1]
MFEEPQTKRIRREDLYSPPPSPTSTVSNSKRSSKTYHLDLQFEEFTPITTPARTDANSGDASASDDDDEFSFPLFSTTTTTVRLRSPTPPPDLYALALRSQSRPAGYYAPTKAQLALLQARAAEVAVSGESVRACSRSLKYAVTGRVLPADGVGDGEKEGRRKRPGKKRRIHLRKVSVKEKALEEARRKSIAGLEKYKGLTPEQREEVAKAERARKNREKKIRERAKKRALQEAEGKGEEKEKEKEKVEKEKEKVEKVLD